MCRVGRVANALSLRWIIPLLSSIVLSLIPVVAARYALPAPAEYPSLEAMEFRVISGQIGIDRSRHVGREFAHNARLFAATDHLTRTDGSDSPLFTEVPSAIGATIIKTPPEDALVLLQSTPTRAISGEPHLQLPRNLAIASIMLLCIAAGFSAIALFRKNRLKGLGCSAFVVLAAIFGGIGSIPALYIGDGLLVHEAWIDNATDRQHLVTFDSGREIAVPPHSHIRTGLSGGSHTIAVRAASEASVIEAYRFQLRGRVGGGPHTHIYNVQAANAYTVVVATYAHK